MIQIEIETETSDLSNGDISKMKQVEFGWTTRTSHMAQNETSRKSNGWGHSRNSAIVTSFKLKIDKSKRRFLTFGQEHLLV